jgi:repressor LexA
MNKLTPRQFEILKFLQECQYAGGNAPTFREIANHFGFKSPKAAADHVTALERKGYVRRRSGCSRGIELLFSERTPENGTISVPLLGHIPAGCPEAQTAYCHNSIAIDKALIGYSAGHRLFALPVAGDSMKGRGIYDGDWIIADAGPPPHEGDVVVALIDGENTLKTLAMKNSRYFLKAENPNFPDLMPLEEMAIQGVVKLVLRRMS